MIEYIKNYFNFDLSPHKGKISEEAEKILNDSQAKKEFIEILSENKEGVIEVDGEKFHVKRNV